MRWPWRMESSTVVFSTQTKYHKRVFSPFWIKVSCMFYHVKLIFCYQNCKLFEITWTIYSNSERSEQFLVTEYHFLPYSIIKTRNHFRPESFTWTVTSNCSLDMLSSTSVPGSFFSLTRLMYSVLTTGFSYPSPSRRN